MHHPFRFPLFLAAVISFGLCCSNSVAQTPAEFVEVRKSIEKRLTTEKVPSVAFAISRDGEVLWADALGYADLEKKLPATPDTSYCLASVSKPITATGIMLLAERGKLNLDRPANDYLGPAKLTARIGDASQATVRRLADHTSGLARHDFFADHKHESLSMEDRITRYGHIVRIPGETYEYSNLGYMTLAYILERQSGKSFPDFMRDEVFQPLGMPNTSVGIDSNRTGYAVCYEANGQVKRPPLKAENCPGHGGIYSSARDLLRFAMFHLEQPAENTKRILTHKSIEAMHVPSVRTAPRSWYGLGWRTEQTEFGYPSLMHTGQTECSTACLVLLPEQKICIVAMTNCPNAIPWHVTQDLIKAVLPKAPPPPEITSGQEQFGRKAFKPTADILGHWTGKIKTHERELPLEMWFEENGRIVAQLNGQAKVLPGGIRVEDGYLRGSFDGDLGTADVADVKYRLHFKLKQRGPKDLNGSVTASSSAGQRVVTLSNWLELRRD